MQVKSFPNLRHFKTREQNYGCHMGFKSKDAFHMPNLEDSQCELICPHLSVQMYSHTPGVCGDQRVRRRAGM